MTDNKDTSNIDELVQIVDNHLNPSTSTSPTGSTRTYTSPLMGTSARAAKRRIDSDSGPIRIEGTDTYNQQLQHHYQNVRQILEDQQQSSNSNIDPSSDSQQSFSAKRDFFEQRFKTPPSTYDTPPRQQGQQIIPSTSTTISSNVQDRTSSSSNESPSVDRVLEQAVELQKMSNINSVKYDSQVPFIIERTEQYQVFLDSSNHEVRRTPSISRTSLIPVTKIGYATDLDQAQAQVERLTDDHQAIQNLTRALQDHNVTTINEYKRLPSQTNPTSSLSSPSSVLLDRTNLSIKSEYSVIDALLNNPVGTIDDKYNYLLNLRSNDISINLRNPEYLNSLKQPTDLSKKSNKKQPKEKKPKEKKVKEKKVKEKKIKEKKPKEKKPEEKKSKKKLSLTTDTVEHAAVTPLVNIHETSPTLTTQKITTTTTTTTTTTIPSEQTPLIDPKEKKKQDIEKKKQDAEKKKQDKEKKKQDNEKKKQTKIKSKQKSKNEDYQVIDAIISSPVTVRLPDSYLIKYNVSAPLSQSSPLQSIPPPIPSSTVVTTTATTTTAAAATGSKDKHTPAADKNQTLFHLAKIVYDLKEHHKAAFATSSNTPTQSKETIIAIKRSEPILKETIHQQHPIISSKQTEIRPQSEPIKPRVIYRYMDEQGRILKISSTPPSKLREQPPQQYIYRNTEPPYFYGRHIAIDDGSRHPLSQYEQRATWQGESKLPTTVTREDLELQDKRVPQLIEQSIPTKRTVPVSVEHERSSRTSSKQQQRTHNFSNQQNFKLAFLPLSYPTEQQYVLGGTAGYDTDSTISERSATFRPSEYVPTDHHYHYPNRPLNHDYYNHSTGPYYYSPPPPLSHNGRGISPEYGNGGISRNYIEVFRGGDFRETKPSEIYSLPLSEHIRTSPMLPTNNRHSRYDQYQSERYGTTSNHKNIPSPPPPPQSNYYYYANTLPNARYQQTVSPTTVHASSYYTHRNPYSHRTVERSPNPEYTTYIRPSKSFDYRPLRTKLQREYKITPNLLVDEWDYPQVSDNIKHSPSTTNRSGVSSPDDVFINNTTTNKA
jgi:hypothetical protein